MVSPGEWKAYVDAGAVATMRGLHAAGEKSGAQLAVPAASGAILGSAQFLAETVSFTYAIAALQYALAIAKQQQQKEAASNESVQ